MHITELDYDLPPERIAQHPADRRDHSRLLFLNRGGLELSHHSFFELPGLLRAGDLLVVNDSRVLPARLLGKKEATGGKWEGLFLKQTPDGLWELMCQTRGHPEPGTIIQIESPQAQPQPLRLRLEGRTENRHWLLQPLLAGTAVDLLEQYGWIPLPPYIRKGKGDESDATRYQTIYARQAGSVAAPTAGLHFTPELIEELTRRGIGRASVTLHVGAGTFQPIQVEDVSQHRVHEEWCQVPEETVNAIQRCKQTGGRVVAVGTTSTRSLETAAAGGILQPWSGPTELTIAPPYRFQVVDGLITNFHLPRSSLLLLVAAFTGWESLRKAYQTAIASDYRFYSYGDAMLIAPWS